MPKRRILGMLAGITATLAVLVAGQTPAEAHQKTIYHGNDFATTSSNHMMGVVYDAEVDGHHICAEWRDEFDTYTECDGGDQQGDTVGPFNFPVKEFRLCEENKGCTAWHSV
jgi:hypothetical protein